MIRSIMIMSLFCCTPAIAQLAIVDSLANLAAQSDKHDRTRLYNQLALVLIEKQQYKEANTYLLRALETSKYSKDIQSKLSTYKELASVSLRSKDFEKTLEYALHLKQLAQQQSDDFFMGYAYAFLSRIKLEEMKALQEAETFIVKSIELFQKVGHAKGLLFAYNTLAIIYDQKDDFPKAIEQYKKALVIAEEMKDFSNTRLIKSNIAGAYVNLGAYELAEQYNQEALNISVEEEDLEMILYDQLLLGLIQFKKGAIDQALANTIAASIIADSLSDFYNLRESYTLQLDIYKHQKNFEQALRIAEKMIILADTINQAEQGNQLAKKESEIELLLKDQELLRLEQVADRQYYLRNGVILISIASLITLCCLYFRKRLLVKMQQKELENLSLQKAMEVRKKEMLKQKLSHKENVLAAKTIDIIQKNEILYELKEEIASLNITSDTTALPQEKITSIATNTDDIDKNWKKFRRHVNDVYPQFFEKLKQQYPILSLKDIRFCTYIKMGLSTKEIAQLTGVNPNSVQKARYRLKRKMNLDREMNLIDCISNIS